MIKRNYSISSIQLFCLVFACVFSGIFLHAGNSLVGVIFSCVFSCAVSFAAGTVCEVFCSSKEFYSFAFGAGGTILRAISLVFLAFSAVGSLAELSADVASLYKGGSAAAVFAVCAAISVFAVSRDFTGAARFAELCAFPLAGILLLSFLGDGGEGLTFSLSQYDLFGAFDAIGCTAVIFSLYLRVITPNDVEMSEFARNGSFHPSPVLCGVLAPVLAGTVYIFVKLFGAEKNILVRMLVWFFALARFFAFALCASDLLDLPDSIGERKGKRALAFAALFAAVILVLQVIPTEAISGAQVLYNAAFPLSAFAGVMLSAREEERK